MRLERADESRALALYCEDMGIDNFPDDMKWEQLPPDVRFLAEARFVVRFGRPMQPVKPIDAGMTPRMVSYGRANMPKEVTTEQYIQDYEKLSSPTDYARI